MQHSLKRRMPTNMCMMRCSNEVDNKTCPYSDKKFSKKYNCERHIHDIHYLETTANNHSNDDPHGGFDVDEFSFNSSKGPTTSLPATEKSAEETKQSYK